jgi:hypothetical protein
MNEEKFKSLYMGTFTDTKMTGASCAPYMSLIQQHLDWLETNYGAASILPGGAMSFINTRYYIQNTQPHITQVADLTLNQVTF